MKTIIIEGPDNTGKDTIINKIKEKFNNPLVIHCGKPISSYWEAARIEQRKLFSDYIKNIVNNEYDGMCDVVIFNRAWYGEYVYGTLYRNRDKNEVREDIKNYEKELFDKDVYYIQLVCSSTELLKNNDDGLSISNKIENFKKENELFKEIFDSSLLKNRKLVYVNDNDNFRKLEDIIKDIFNFLNLGS